MSKGLSYQSRIATPPVAEETASGKRYIAFDLATGRGRLMQCTAWCHKLEGLDLEALEHAVVDSPITVRGFEGDKGDFVVTWFKFDQPLSEQAELSELERIYVYYGGKRRTQELCAEFQEEMASKDFVRVKPLGERSLYVHKRHCIFDATDKRWHRKMDFCMDVLGVARVRAELKKLFPTGVSLESIATGKFPSDAYKALLDRLIPEALHIREMDQQNRST